MPGDHGDMTQTHNCPDLLYRYSGFGCLTETILHLFCTILSFIQLLHYEKPGRSYLRGRNERCIEQHHHVMQQINWEALWSFWTKPKREVSSCKHLTPRKTYVQQLCCTSKLPLIIRSLCSGWKFIGLHAEHFQVLHNILFHYSSFICPGGVRALQVDTCQL